ncbi:MAG TPA: hypothetical protein PLM35_07255, partial [Cyclobacteriaceae bacterium]|nr:hypothetical protein [Cyclobacteriaceae bacterium]
ISDTVAVRQVLDDMRAASGHLKTLSAQMASGKGTFGRLVNDEAACRKMADASRAHIKPFGPKPFADKLMEVYKEVMG